MKSLLIALIPGAFIFLVIWPCLWLALHAYKRGKKGRRSPLTSKLLRAPGQSIIPQIDEISDLKR